MTFRPGGPRTQNRPPKNDIFVHFFGPKSGVIFDRSLGVNLGGPGVILGSQKCLFDPPGGGTPPGGVKSSMLGFWQKPYIEPFYAVKGIVQNPFLGGGPSGDPPPGGSGGPKTPNSELKMAILAIFDPKMAIFS